MIEETYWVEVTSDESVPYIENHFKNAKAKLIRIVPKRYNLLLKYKESEFDLVENELKELQEYGILRIERKASQ